MRRIRFSINVLAATIFLLALSTIANAQATRTWVSGVGDDVNPCSRTAPCKTYAGAISKTAAGGEISTLDPGGFGAVTITKSMTIEGTKGQGYGSILASATNGVVINDSLSGTPQSVIVTLRNLSINGAPPTQPGLNGIKFIAGKQLHVEDCQIFGFKATSLNNGNGIDINLTAAASGGGPQKVNIRNTIIRDCQASGIIAKNTNAAGVSVNLEGVQISNVTDGLSASTNARVIASNSSFAHNTGAGVGALAGNLGVDLHNCMIYGNASGIAIAANTTRISGNTITNNTNGINLVGGALLTYGDNKTQGNVNEVIGGVIPPATNKK